MVWTPGARDYFFVCDDDDFRRRYCSERLNTNLNTAQRMGIPICTMRHVLRTLAELVPEAAHATPGWNSNPLVAMGRIRDNGDITVNNAANPDDPFPRFGVCRIGKKLHLFADKATVDAFEDDYGRQAWKKGWQKWGPDKRYPKVYLPTALDKTPPESWDSELTYFFGWISMRLEEEGPAIEDDALPAPNVKALADRLRDHRKVLDEPDWIDAIHPRLIEAFRGVRSAELPDSTRTPPVIRQAEVDPANPVEAPSEAKSRVTRASEPSVESGQLCDDDSWLGAVFQGSTGISSLVVQRSKSQEEIGKNLAYVIFLVVGPKKEGVSEIVESVKKAEVKADPSENKLLVYSCPEATDQGSFIYLYFNNGDARWDNVFYIGKGVKGRDRQQIQDVCRKRANGQLTGLSGKEQRINAFIQQASAPAITNIGTYNSACKTLGKSLVRRVFAFNGNYTEQCAFCVESFLITRKYGAYNVANVTNGNDSTGPYACLTRPKVCAGTEIAWRKAVCSFVARGWTDPLEKAALLTLSVESLVRGFRPPPGLVPFPVTGRKSSSHGGLPHLSVSGSGDATISYRFGNTFPYFIDLKFRATSPDVRVNLRPPPGQENQFVQYFRCKGITIRNQTNEPYVKPFAPAGLGRKDCWFSIADPTFQTSVAVGWLPLPCDLTLSQALCLLKVHFP